MLHLKQYLNTSQQKRSRISGWELSEKIMAITVEKFDRSIYDTEKRSFQIGRTVYNVSEGTYSDWNDDELDCSPLWGNWRTIEELRQELWSEIQSFMPTYLESGMDAVRKRRRLIYISNRDHAEMIARCIQYVADQIRPF